MKKAAFLFTLLVANALLVSSCKKENASAGTPVPVNIIKDCTGNYLRYQGKDYKICNGNIAAPFPDSMGASAVFTLITDCKSPEAVGICALYHKHEGWIEVQQLNWPPD